MRKRVRVARAVSVPMLINRGLQNDELEMRERMLVEAFAGGWATTEHFDNLADMRDCLMLAAADRNDQPVLALCRAAAVALQNIRVRQGETGRFGASGEEVDTEAKRWLDAEQARKEAEAKAKQERKKKAAER